MLVIGATGVSGFLWSIKACPCASAIFLKVNAEITRAEQNENHVRDSSDVLWFAGVTMLGVCCKEWTKESVINIKIPHMFVLIFRSSFRFLGSKTTRLWDCVILIKGILNWQGDFCYVQTTPISTALQWRHNERNGVSNHQHHHCLLNRLFRRWSKKTPKLRVTGLC